MKNMAFMDEDINRLWPYISATAAILTVLFLYWQHRREERLAKLEVELHEWQLKQIKETLSA